MRNFTNSIDPFFEITKAPVSVNGRVYPEFVANMNPSGGIIGIVSDHYEIVTNQEVLDISTRAFADLPVEKIYDHVSLNGGSWKRHVILDKNAFDFKIIGNDSMGIMIEIFNSYSGKNAWGFNLLGMRWVCGNGMVFGRKPIFTNTFRHTIDAVEKMRDKFAISSESVPNVIDEFVSWADVPFSVEEFEDFLTTKKVGERMKDVAVNTYSKRVETEGTGFNKWAAYNALTYVATHETKARKGANPMFSASTKKFFDLANDFFEPNYGIKEIAA